MLSGLKKDFRHWPEVSSSLVPGAGFEPARPEEQGILSVF